MKWGRYRRGRGIGTGRGSGDQRSVIMKDSGRKGCGGRVVVNMASDVAHWIRGWLPQNDIPIARGCGESCWGCIGTLVQSNVSVANRSQDMERHRPSVILRFENDLIPESTELVL